MIFSNDGIGGCGAHVRDSTSSRVRTAVDQQLRRPSAPKHVLALPHDSNAHQKCPAIPGAGWTGVAAGDHDVMADTQHQSLWRFSRVTCGGIPGSRR